MYDSESYTERYYVNAMAGASYEIVKGLKADFQVGADISFDEGKSWSGEYLSNGKPSASKYTNKAITVQTTTQLSYDRTFGKHSVNAVAAMETQNYQLETLSGSASELKFPNLKYDNLAQAGSTTVGSGYTMWSLMSFIGRVNYSFDGRYMASVSVRHDGSSKFASGNKYSTFPAAALAWNAHNENFIKDLNVFSTLKLRLSWILSHENYSPNQVSVRNTYLSRTPVAVSFRESGRKISSPSRYCKIENFTNGLHMNSMESDPEFKSEVSIKQLKDNSFSIINDIPGLPDMSKWKNVLDLGVKGDGETDDTEAIAKAVDNYDVLYFPQGWYKLTKTVKLKKNTVIIGLNPITTVLFAEDGTPAFSGFGGPAALIETPMGGSNIINGVGVSTGAYNYRAVGCKWQSGAGSYMNDVRFLGGHGDMTRNSNKRTPVVRKPEGVSTQENPVNYQGKDKAWDNQYWSLWITNGGGGTFKDIWTPDSYSANGLYISDTETPSAMYEISVEHHVRNEVRIRNVKNWKFYALQLEEELREGPDVQPIEIENSENLLFANLYLFRVIWIDTPLPCAVRTWGCRDIEFYNVHNFTQMHQTTDVTIKDMNTGLEVLPWEFTRLTITGNEKKAQPVSGDVVRLATGFEYVHGMAQDSQGNIYFCEQRMRRIYRYSPADEKVTLVADYPWPVLSLAVDTEDNLLVCVKYTPQPGFVPKEAVKVYDDRKGTTFSWWGNDGFEPRFYSINPDDPESSFTILAKKQVKDVSGVGRVCVPSHRWRDLNDFDEVVKASVDTVFVAPDGVTVIPDVYDLLRSSSLLAVSPGETAYVSDEYNHRVFSVVYETMERVEAQEFVNAGQFSATPGGDKVFVADGLIYVCNLKGEIIGKIRLPERPSSIIMGKDGYLYASAVSSLYRINITHS